MKRRDLLGAALSAPFLHLTASAAVPYNIVLLIADDMKVEQLNRMPQVSKLLAATGVRFSNAFAATPLCQPARATFLTGQYAHNHGINTNVDSWTLLNPQNTLLAARLQAAGYTTSHIGKFLNSFLVSTDGIPSGWSDWHATTSGTADYLGYTINDNGALSVPGVYHTTTLTNRAVSFINSTSQPFFLQVSYFAPHFTNADPNVPYAVTSDADYSGVVSASQTFPQNSNYNHQITNAPAYMQIAAIDAPTLANINTFWRQQTQALFSVDRSIQAIVAALSSAGKLANTVIIFVSDNGYMHGEERDPNQKTVPYIPSTRIPFIISAPSALAPTQGAICSKLVSHVDLAATIFALSGTTAGRTGDGTSLLPLLANPNSASVRSYLLVESLASYSPGVTSPISSYPIYSMLLSSRYAYIELNTGEKELYDLSIDPFQTNNVVANGSYAAAVADLSSRLVGAKTCTGSSCVIA